LTKDELKAGYAVERQVVSTLCQGGAADVVAGALRRLREEMRGEARLLLQVHDEILMDRGPLWSDQSLAKFTEIAESKHGYDLHVPLEFEAKTVSKWGEKGGGHGFSGFMAKVRESRS
jgi:DNA polymerase I-like protein with 3'-5' exonuclease and polymerase domains